MNECQPQRPAADASAVVAPHPRSSERGQTLVVFAFSMVVLCGFLAFVVDMSWFWSSALRVQRAADAAALAGVVYLPGNVPAAVTAAKASATQNGFAHGVGGVVVLATQDVGDERRMAVTIRAPIGTFFMRVFGMQSILAVKKAKAEFVQALAMGSPQSYYGVDVLRRAVGSPIPVPNAGGSGTLASQGAWGAIITKGGQHQNGDAYSPVNDNLRGGANIDYDANGYPYRVVIPPGSSNGGVHIFDATFCGVGPNTSSGYYGTGDHWIGTSGTPVSTYFDLYNENDTPYQYEDDVLVASSGNLFENEIQTDQSRSGTGSNPPFVYGTPQLDDTDGVADCSTHPQHNAWWQLASGLTPGIYRLQVTTTNPGNSAINSGTNAENMWSVQATATGSTAPQVHGAGRMAVYNNLVSGLQKFYLAKIDALHAGKTLQLDLFDPGDVSGNAYLKILSPNGNAYNYVNFSFTTDNQCSSNCSGTNVNQIQTAWSSGSRPYNNTWLTISISLPTSYGSTGLTPAGESEAGWWKVEYNVTGGNDTTTWRAQIRGNPVHLIVP